MPRRSASGPRRSTPPHRPARAVRRLGSAVAVRVLRVGLGGLLLVPAAAPVVERGHPDKAVQASATGSARRAIASICQHTTRRQPSNLGLISWMNGGRTTTSAGRDRARGRAELLGGLLGTAKHAVPPVLRPRLGRFDTHYRARPLAVPASYLRASLPPAAPLISIVVPSLNQGRLSVRPWPASRPSAIRGSSGSSPTAARATTPWRCSPTTATGSAGSNPGPTAARRWLSTASSAAPGARSFAGSTPTTSCFPVRSPSRPLLRRPPQVDLVYGYRVLIDECGNDIGLWTMPPHSRDALRWIDLVPQEAAFSRRDLWRRLGGLEQGLEIAFDWDFFRRAEAAGARIARLPRFLGAMRQHRGQSPGRANRSRSPSRRRSAPESSDQPLTRAQTRARLLGDPLRSPPYQYAHAVRARLGVRRVPVSLPPARSAQCRPARGRRGWTGDLARLPPVSHRRAGKEAAGKCPGDEPSMPRAFATNTRRRDDARRRELRPRLRRRGLDRVPASSPIGSVAAPTPRT